MRTVALLFLLLPLLAIGCSEMTSEPDTEASPALFNMGDTRPSPDVNGNRVICVRSLLRPQICRIGTPCPSPVVCTDDRADRPEDERCPPSFSLEGAEEWAELCGATPNPPIPNPF